MDINKWGKFVKTSVHKKLKSIGKAKSKAYSRESAIGIMNIFSESYEGNQE